VFGTCGTARRRMMLAGPRSRWRHTRLIKLRYYDIPAGMYSIPFGSAGWFCCLVLHTFALFHDASIVVSVFLFVSGT
jgi:hypothetical protein